MSGPIRIEAEACGDAGRRDTFFPGLRDIFFPGLRDVQATWRRATNAAAGRNVATTADARVSDPLIAVAFHAQHGPVRTAGGGIRNARRAFLTVAAMALVAASVACGVEVSRQNYEATEKSIDSMQFFIAGTQTRTASAVTVEGPYRVIVQMTTPDAEAGTLSARKLRVKRGGEVVFEREDAATAGANPRRIEVPLGDALTWSEDDTIVATVEVMRPGAPSYEKLEKTFRATREHASYSFCQRISMH